MRSDRGREHLFKTISNMFGSDVITAILNCPNVRNRPGEPSYETDNPSAPSSSSISSSSREILQARTVFREMKDSTYSDLSNASVYLAAGTSTGCAYIWKISIAELQSGVPYSASTYDDGSKLHSLLQSSDHPIVQIALSSADTHGPASDPRSHSFTQVQPISNHFCTNNFYLMIVFL